MITGYKEAFILYRSPMDLRSGYTEPSNRPRELISVRVTDLCDAIDTCKTRLMTGDFKLEEFGILHNDETMEHVLELYALGEPKFAHDGAIISILDLLNQSGMFYVYEGRSSNPNASLRHVTLTRDEKRRTASVNELLPYDIPHSYELSPHLKSNRTLVINSVVWGRAIELYNFLNQQEEMARWAIGKYDKRQNAAEEADNFMVITDIFDILEEIAQATHYHGLPIGQASHYGNRSSDHFSFSVTDLEKREHYKLAMAIARADHAKEVYQTLVKFQADFQDREDLFLLVVQMFKQFVTDHCTQNNYRNLFIANIYGKTWDKYNRRVLITVPAFKKERKTTTWFHLNI